MSSIFDKLDEGECMDIVMTEMEGKKIPKRDQEEMKVSVCKVDKDEISIDMPGEESDYSMKFKKRKI